MWVLYPGRIGIWRGSYCGGRKPEKNPQSKATTNKTLNPGCIGGKQALSPLCHPCSPGKTKIGLKNQAVWGIEVKLQCELKGGNNI